MTAPNADTQVYNTELGLSPTDPTGYAQYWMSRIRARKIKGDNIDKGPFTRSWTVNGVTTNVVASPSEQDKGTAVADATGFRYVDSTNDVVDVGDMLIVFYEYLILKDPTGLAEAIKNAGVLRDWPTGYTGAASFDTGS